MLNLRLSNRPPWWLIVQMLLVLFTALSACMKAPEPPSAGPKEVPPAPLTNDAEHRHADHPEQDKKDDEARSPRPNQLDGLALYESHCLSCHGNIDESSVDEPNLSAIKAAFLSIDLMRMSGISLTDAELDAIAFAIQKARGEIPEEGGDPEFDPTPVDTDQASGFELYQKNCQACHGMLEESTVKSRPASAIRNALAEVGQMSAIKLSDRQIEAIATVLRDDKIGVFGCEQQGSDVVAEPIRPLSRLEYRNTLESLFGRYGVMDEIRIELAAIPKQSASQKFDNIGLTLSQDHFRQYQTVAIKLSRMLLDRSEFVEEAFGDSACIQSEQLSDTCLNHFLSNYAYRLSRRPMEAADREVYQSLRRPEADGLALNARQQAQALLQSMLVSADFVFHLYVRGESAGANSDLMTLTSYELASRLSYALWASPPDQQLYELARSSTILDDAVFRTQVDRMLADPKARRHNAAFFEQWLGLKPNAQINLSPVILDGLQVNQSLLDEIGSEAADFVNWVIFDQSGGLEMLLSSDFAQPKSELYRQIIDSQNASSEQRPGLLWRLILSHSTFQNERNLIHSGKIIRENLLCESLPLPTDEQTAELISDATKTSFKSLSARKEIEKKTAPAACSGCHAKINPLAFASANAYDSIGRFITEERRIDDNGTINRFPVDTSVSDPHIDAAGEASVDGPLQMAKALASSKRLSACLVQSRYSALMGRKIQPEHNQDACNLQRSFDRIHDGKSFLDMLSAMLGPEFKLRKPLR